MRNLLESELSAVSGGEAHYYQNSEGEWVKAEEIVVNAEGGGGSGGSFFGSAALAVSVVSSGAETMFDLSLEVSRHLPVIGVAADTLAAAEDGTVTAGEIAGIGVGAVSPPFTDLVTQPLAEGVVEVLDQLYNDFRDGYNHYVPAYVDHLSGQDTQN